MDKKGIIKRKIRNKEHVIGSSSQACGDRNDEELYCMGRIESFKTYINRKKLNLKSKNHKSKICP